MRRVGPWVCRPPLRLRLHEPGRAASVCSQPPVERVVDGAAVIPVGDAEDGSSKGGPERLRLRLVIARVNVQRVQRVPGAVNLATVAVGGGADGGVQCKVLLGSVRFRRDPTAAS
jgi:hypothetical protein